MGLFWIFTTKRCLMLIVKGSFFVPMTRYCFGYDFPYNHNFPDICEIHFLHFYYSNWFDSVDQILSFLQKTHHFWKISQFFRWIYIHLQFLFVKFFFFTFLPSIISSVSKTLVLSSVKSWSPILSEMRNILQSFVTRFTFAEAANESVL